MVIIQVGIALSEGENAQVKLYLSAKSPQEVNDAVEVLVNMVFNEANITFTFEVLGHDFGGESLAMR